MPKMRTINEAYKAIKAEDPETAITPHAIRRLILKGSIPCVRAGNKYLIDLDGLKEYLKNPLEETGPAHDYGKIRPISERSVRR